MRKIFWVLAVTAAVLTFVVLLSPYSKHDGNAYRSVRQTITINAAPEVVFSYLGNSANAAWWSVYVDHIVTLNCSQVKDGMPGSIRRCFKQANEKGIVWDELITVVEPARKRQLTIFNMVGFPVKAEGLASQQLYERVSGNSTRLTFTLFYLDEPGFRQTLKTYLAAYIVDDIFKKNLENIKSNIEKGPTS